MESMNSTVSILSSRGAWSSVRNIWAAFDFTKGSYLLDAAGDPTGVDGQIAKVLDISGVGNHLLQATSGNQPLVKTASGITVLRTDGTDDWMKTAEVTAIAQKNTVFLSALVRDQSADQILMDGRAGGQRHVVGVSSVGDTARIDAGVNDVSALGIDYGTAHVWVCMLSATQTRLYRDGGTAEAMSVGINGIDGITIGTHYDEAAEPADADYYGLAVVNGEASIGEINAVGRELALSCGATWTTVTA